MYAIVISSVTKVVGQAQVKVKELNTCTRSFHMYCLKLATVNVEKIIGLNFRGF